MMLEAQNWRPVAVFPSVLESLFIYSLILSHPLEGRLFLIDDVEAVESAEDFTVHRPDGAA